VAAGNECGLQFEDFEDFQVGDVIECALVESIKKSLIVKSGKSVEIDGTDEARQLQEGVQDKIV
jgi:hypothetical protein